jgi:hypothetical protein
MEDMESYIKATTNIMLCTVVLDALGALGNVVAFWVWLGEKHKSSATLLFMYLAIWDTMFLLMNFSDKFIVSFLASELVGAARQMHPLTLSMHTTALITLNRFVTVWKPMQVHTVMSRRRVIILCVVTSMWCVLLIALTEAFHSYWKYIPEFSADIPMWIPYVLMFLKIVLPNLVLIAFSVGILWMTFKHRR